MPTDKLLELEGLTKYFYKPMGLLGRRKQVVQSVDHVSFHIPVSYTHLRMVILMMRAG